MAGTGAMIVRERALVFLLAVAMAAVLLVVAGVRPAEAVVPGANGKIFFSSARDGDSEIYSMYPNGKGLKKLTNNNVSDEDPAVSPDGSKVVFVSSRDAANFDGNTEIYVMDADGSDQTRLTNDPVGSIQNWDFRPTFSPDGIQIAWEHERDIYVMNADGTGTPANLTGSDWTGVDTDPAFSPDGDQIAFTSNRAECTSICNHDVYVMDTNPATTGATRLTDTPGLDSEPSWSPDGARIAFQSGRDSGFHIYVMDANGTNETLLADATTRDEMPAFSPDGQSITFAGTPTSYPEIYVTDSDPQTSDTPTKLTNNGAFDNYPDWSLVPSSGGECTVTGTPGDDVITPGSTPGSTSGDDVICGLGGNDTIDAGEGDDTVRSGDGNDVVTGGAGEDDLFGEYGNDRLRGGGDGDFLVGGFGSDRLFGEAGADTLDAKDTKKRNDRADGGPGNDACAADRGDRRVSC